MAWRFVYSNALTAADNVGRVVPARGDKAQLFQAIRDGADIRVGYEYNAMYGGVVRCTRWNTEGVRMNADETEAFAVVLVHASNLMWNPSHKFMDQHGPYEGIIMDAWFQPGICVLGTDGYERFWRQGHPVYINNQPNVDRENGRRVIQWFADL